MKSKIIKVLLLILAVVLVVFVVIQYRYTKNVKNDIEYTDDIESLMIPTGSFHFVKNYQGDNKNTVLYNGIFKFSKYLPKWQEDLKGKSESEIKDYYKENIEKIRACSGITNDEKFVKLMSYINNFETFQNPKSADIDENSFVNNPTYLSFKITLTYENGDIPVICQYDNVYRANNDAFEFLPIKE